MAKKNIVNEKMANAMVEMYTVEGLSANKIGVALGVTKRTVLMHLNKRGVERKTSRALFLEKKSDILRMHGEGASVDAICKELNTKHTQVVSLLSDNGLITLRRRRIEYNDGTFRNIDSEEKAYWLGFIYADGCISDAKGYLSKLNITIKDREHIEKFISFIGGNNEDMLRVVDDSYFSVTVNCKEMCEDLFRHGVTPRKSLTLKFPTGLEDSLMRHFLRGYFDGDGSICIRERTYHNNSNRHLVIQTGAVGTKEFLTETMMHFYEKANARLVSLYCHGTNTYEYRKQGKEAIKVISYLYDDCHIYLDRKYEKYLIAVLRSDAQ